jgi:isoquinoline 1-oxidoreductase beta subunit
VRPDRCTIWTGTQAQTGDRDVAARITGLDPSRVALNTMFLGGGFGRRSVPDHHFVAEAVQVSKAVGAPVKVVWTREDDVRGGYYRPAALHSLRGGLDGTGKPVAWAQRIVCQSFWGEAEGVDESAVEGAQDLPYAIPNVRVEWQPAPGGVPTLWWRSVGHSHTAFAVECFLDELAHAAGTDPLELRRSLLADHPRHLGVLELAAEKAGWGRSAPPGRGRGLAVHQSFGSLVAQVAEVSVAKGEVTVHKVVCAVDCGPVVNPDTIAAQMESAVAFGLTAALHGEITFRKGRVQEGNFDDYPLLRMSQMPEVETHIVPSTGPVGGIGEPGLPPVAPAVMNAVFAATGKRVRRLPVRGEDLT